MEVYFDNRSRTFEFSPGFEEDIRKAVLKSLEVEGLDDGYEVSFSIVDEDEIKDLNANFRGVDKVTDVLSFHLFEEDGSLTSMLGDIVICYDRAKSQACDFGHSIQREIVYLTVHSMFHLLGYDHMTDSDKLEMRAREKETIRRLGIYKNEG